MYMYGHSQLCKIGHKYRKSKQLQAYVLKTIPQIQYFIKEDVAENCQR